MGDAPIRWTKKEAAFELSWFRFFLIKTWRAIKWVCRKLKPLLYHPIALIGITVFIISYIITPWLTATILWGILIWQRGWPYHYNQHVQPRVNAFIYGFKYRTKLRPKFKSLGLLTDDEPLNTISRVEKHGCTTTLIIKMSYGDDLRYWQERSSRIAQTLNAKRAIINGYRRPHLLPWKHEQIEKYRWLKIDLLTKDPFTHPTGIEYIHQYRVTIIQQTNPQGELIDTYQPNQAEPLGPSTDGTPYMLDTNLSLLNVSITGGGKSNAERTHIKLSHQVYRRRPNQVRCAVWKLVSAQPWHLRVDSFPITQ